MSSLVSVYFPNTRVQPERVYEMTYRQKNYEHDFAKLYFRDWNLDVTKVKPGSPMQLTVQGREFVGYVHDIKANRDSKSNFTEVSFIGASYVMRQASQQTYKNVTASMVAEKIAKKYGFSYKIVPHPRVFPQLSQAGMTDWEFLVKLAKQCGYFMRVTSTSLYFQPILQEFDEKIGEAPKYTQIDAGFKSQFPLYSFSPRVGETLTHQGADKSAVSIAGVNPETGQYFKYTKQRRGTTTRAISQPELFDKHATATVAPSYEAAVYEAISADEKSKFPYVAEAEILGNSTVSPGSPIYLDGLGNKYSGYWTVLEVEHHVVEESLNQYRFTTELHVGTDSLGASNTAKYPAAPSGRTRRSISPAVRNTRIVPKNVIKNPGMSVNPAKVVKLVDRINRPADSGPKVTQATWSSTAGNISAKPVKPGRSPVAQAKVMNYFGRQ